MMKAKKIITDLLLVFVIFSIGFAVGRETGARRSAAPAAEAAVQPTETKTIVYYFRSTFRCYQCNMIEIYTDELIQIEFDEYLADGSLEWHVVDYLQQRRLADRYNISGNTVIVSRHEDGQEVNSIRLGHVMEKVLHQDDFMQYVRQAIQKQLSGLSRRNP